MLSDVRLLSFASKSSCARWSSRVTCSGPREIEDRSALGAEQRALVGRGQKAGAPVERAAFHPLVVSQHDVAGQVLVLAPQAISDPRARARETRAAGCRC